MSESETPKYSKGLSKQQRSLIYWLAEEEEFFHDSVKEGMRFHRKSVINSAQQFFKIGSGRIPKPSDPGPRPMPKPKYFGTSWRTSKYLGYMPSSSESTSVNRSLAKLEARGLVKLTRSRGKGKRISHVKLTSEGIQAAIEMKDS